MIRLSVSRVSLFSLFLLLAVVITGARDVSGPDSHRGDAPGRVELRAPAVLELLQATEGRARVDVDEATGLASFVGFGPDGFSLETEAERLENPADRGVAFLARFGNAFGIRDASIELAFVGETANATGSQVEFLQVHDGVPASEGSLRVYFGRNASTPRSPTT